MSGHVKLTTPQRRLLSAAANTQGVYAVDTYPPVKKLLALGFVELRGERSCRWFATNLGRAWLGLLPAGKGEGG